MKELLVPRALLEYKALSGTTTFAMYRIVMISTVSVSVYNLSLVIFADFCFKIINLEYVFLGLEITIYFNTMSLGSEGWKKKSTAD